MDIGDIFGDPLVRGVLAGGSSRAEEADWLVRKAAGMLTAGAAGVPEPSLDRRRVASFALLVGMAEAVLGRKDTLEERLRGRTYGDQSPDLKDESDLKNEIAAVRRLAHEMGRSLYHASADLETERMGRSGRTTELTAAEKRRFLRESMPLIELLIRLSFPDVVHDVMKTLVACVDLETRAVFLTAAKAIRQGETGFYHAEPLAVGLVVGLVRRYLADHRAMLREDSECRDALMGILNTFVLAGWPAALELTFRLEEIYR